MDWYEVVDGKEKLMQGDFVVDCPIINPPPKTTGPTAEVDVDEYDVIIMSQSCDLDNEKLEIVLVCPVCSFQEFCNNDGKKMKELAEPLRKGNVIGDHLLNRCDIEGFEKEHIVVDFHSVFGVPYSFLKEYCVGQEKRLRLKSPYREHLSQAFARFFMRVGLPEDIKQGFFEAAIKR